MLAGVFFVCVLGAVVFGARAVLLAVYWSDPAHVAQVLEPWMTPRYVARSYKVEPYRLAVELGLNQGSGVRPTLEELARRHGLSFADYAVQVQQAIMRARAEPHG